MAVQLANINETSQARGDSRELDAKGRERLLVVSLEFSKRALEARSLEELGFLLTNDVRTIIEFDRCSLFTHMGGESRFVGASNQPVVEKKSGFTAELNGLAAHLRSLKRPLFITDPSGIRSLSDEDLNPEIKEALVSYANFAKCKGIVCVPLNYDGETLGHLFLEYLDGKAPNQFSSVALIKLAPFLASALAQRWLRTRDPRLVSLTQTTSWRDSPGLRRIGRYLPLMAIVITVLIYALFFLPVSHPVGGEAEIVAQDRHLAFSQIEGLIDRINVAEGTTVEKGQVVAALDSTELDFKTAVTRRELDLLNQQKALLKRSASQDISKLAESKLVELKAKTVLAQLDYLEWQKRLLDIKAPASGIVITKHVDTLVGKKLKAGEPFCEIAVPGELCTQVYVPEDKVGRLKTGQEGNLYLNDKPMTGYPIVVTEVAPAAEAVPRLGNVYQVKAAIRGENGPPVKVGMKGVGKIYTEKSNVYSILTQRLYTRWNEFTLYFF
ncbi:MAG: efflux RND transporter periplasmic adaptor subunit [Desulfomonilaceae bacterium]|nr:efflux RND transporter periplasmic adaptor subunit [Desulfomonilaceae bacterium]